MLQLIASILSWTDDQREKVGLQRASGALSGSSIISSGRGSSAKGHARSGKGKAVDEGAENEVRRSSRLLAAGVLTICHAGSPFRIFGSSSSSRKPRPGRVQSQPLRLPPLLRQRRRTARKHLLASTCRHSARHHCPPLRPGDQACRACSPTAAARLPRLAPRRPVSRRRTQDPEALIGPSPRCTRAPRCRLAVLPHFSHGFLTRLASRESVSVVSILLLLTLLVLSRYALDATRRCSPLALSLRPFTSLRDIVSHSSPACRSSPQHSHSHDARSLDVRRQVHERHDRPQACPRLRCARLSYTARRRVELTV